MADAPKHVGIAGVQVGNDLPFALLAGPCAMESRQHALDMAGALVNLTRDLGIGFIYKTSFDKANRTSLTSSRGVGLDGAIPVFHAVKREFGCPVVTDIHEAEQCRVLAEAQAVDVLQIPAFLCRQTDLLIAAAKTGLAVNVKKGQFLAPWDMKNVVAKITGSGNERVLVTERGASFGYNTLVSDMRALPILARDTGAPVIFDATHSVQKPGALGDRTGGDRRMVPVLTRAAIAAGCDGVFLETHPNPDEAKSDGPNMLPLDALPELLAECLRIRAALSRPTHDTATRADPHDSHRHSA